MASSIGTMKKLDPQGDADVYRWPIEGFALSEPIFTDVKIVGNARLKGDDMTEHSIRAVETGGRSEVERHLADPLPPRVIEVGTVGDPRVVQTWEL
jgi:hypothetical protein